MRSAVTLAAILVFGVGDAIAADCPAPTPAPTRSGTLVTIVVDFCKTAATEKPAKPAPAAPPAMAAPSGTPPVSDLYGEWSTQTKQSKPPAAAPAGAAAASQPPAVPFVPDFSNLLDGPETSELKGVRIDERDRVALALQHFNFVNFGAEYTIEKTVIEAYVTLNTLWSQVLGLGSMLTLRAASDATPCPADAEFRQCVVDWMWALVLTSRRLDHATALNKDRVALDDTMIGNLTIEAGVIRTLRSQLLQLQAETLTRRPESMQEIEWYKQVQASHDKLISQIDAFAVLAELTRKGQVKSVDKQPAGTLVTVRITAKNAVGNPASKVEIQYFVHSRYPLTFHAGYLYSSLKEVKFDQLRTVAGADLFAQVQKPSSVSTYAAFLSYQIVGRNTGRYATGVLATLGTDFKDPGKRLYVGGSVRFLSRVFVGGGVLSANATEGLNPVVEQIGDELGTRELFSALTTRREWKPFFHASFGVFN